MQRACFHTRLFAGTEDEYDRRYRAVPTALVDAFRRYGIQRLSSFRRGTDVWTYAECGPDRGTALGGLHDEPANREWERELRSIVADGTTHAGEPITYDEIFHADGSRGGGPVERGMFALVVDPERVSEYDARHATIWPDMLEALRASGFGNYSGFRRGSQVVYYGEFDPDMTTAFARMGETDVNRRWGESFAGIITTLTDTAGQVFRAQEVFYLD
jgi:L-rhamnose mutarotase